MLVLLLRERPLLVLAISAHLRANALEHLAVFVEGLNACQVLQKLLLLKLRHVVHRLLRGGVYACGC